MWCFNIGLDGAPGAGVTYAGSSKKNEQRKSHCRGFLKSVAGSHGRAEGARPPWRALQHRQPSGSRHIAAYHKWGKLKIVVKREGGKSLVFQENFTSSWSTADLGICKSNHLFVDIDAHPSPFPFVRLILAKRASFISQINPLTGRYDESHPPDLEERLHSHR